MKTAKLYFCTAMGKNTIKEITQGLEEVLSDPRLFKTHFKNVKGFYENFDKSKYIEARNVASKILKMKSATVQKKHIRAIGQLLTKYRFVLLGQKKIVEDQICNDNNEIVDQYNVSYCYDTCSILPFLTVL